MVLINPKQPGHTFIRKSVNFPPRSPGSLQVISFAIRRKLADSVIGRFIIFSIHLHPCFFGEDSDYCEFLPTAIAADAFMDATSGVIKIEEYASLIFGVSLMAGYHDYATTGLIRQRAVPRPGYDIAIGAGAWVEANVTIVGPCRIGRNAVVAAGAVVVKDVAENALVAEVSARIIKILELSILNEPENS